MFVKFKIVICAILHALAHRGFIIGTHPPKGASCLWFRHRRRCPAAGCDSLFWFAPQLKDQYIYDQCAQAKYEEHNYLINISMCISHNLELFHFENNHIMIRIGVDAII